MQKPLDKRLENHRGDPWIKKSSSNSTKHGSNNEVHINGGGGHRFLKIVDSTTLHLFTSTGNLSHIQSTTKNHEIYNLKTGYFRGFMINNNVPGSYTIDLINLLPQFVKKINFLQY